METISPPINFTDSDYLDATGGAILLNAVQPLSYDGASHTIAVANAGVNSPGVVSTIAQTFGGAKSFAMTPNCSISPVQPGDLANKAYVDTLAQGLSWQASIIGFIDMTTLEPAQLAVGDRYIADRTAGDFIKDYIYQWSNLSEWTEIKPEEGNALYVSGDTGSFANSTVVYNGSIWTSLGSTILHNALIGAGTLTHATIDSYLNQAVRTTSSPSFSTLAITDVTDSTTSTTGALTVAGGVGIAKALRVGGFTQINSRFEVANVTAATSTNGSIRTPGGLSVGSGAYIGSDTVLASATASTSAATGALTVVGGVGIGGDVNVTGHLTAGGNITATAMTCSSAPVADTDVVRYSDLSSYTTSSALAALVDQDVRTTATPSWPVVTVTGAFPDYHTFAATGGVRGGLYRQTVYDTQMDSDEVRPSIVSLFTAPPTVPLVAGFKRWRHAIFGVNAGTHGPSIGALVIDSVAGNGDGYFNERAIELNNVGTKWFGAVRPALIAMPTFGVQHNAIADADRTTKAFLAMVPGDKTSVQYATITYYQDTASNGSAYIRFGNTRDSTSATAGGVVFDGGIAIAKNAYVGGSTNISGTLCVTDATASTTTATGALVVTGGAGISGAIYVGASINACSVEDSAGPPTGSIICAGGIGVAKSITVGDNVGVSGIVTASRMICTTAPSANTDVVRKIDIDNIISETVYGDVGTYWDCGGTQRQQIINLRRIGHVCTLFSNDTTSSITFATAGHFTRLGADDTNPFVIPDGYKPYSAYSAFITALVNNVETQVMIRIHTTGTGIDIFANYNGDDFAANTQIGLYPFCIQWVASS